MPIIARAGAASVVPVEPLEPLPPKTPPATPLVTWEPAGGEPIVLSTKGGTMLGGVGEPGAIVGLDAPPNEEFYTDLPIAGAQLNHRRWGVRNIALPIVIHADTLEGLEAERRALIAAFNPARGEGVLTISYPAGDSRSVWARYSSGLDAPTHGRMGGLYFDSYQVVLKAQDPFAYGPERVERFYPGGEGGNFFPVPFTISSGVTTGNVEVTIDGEVPVYPVWVITGPMGGVTLRNRDTGQALILSPDLSQGETLIVRTDPRTPPSQRITSGGGSNRWRQAAGDQFPVFWPLEPGRNRVEVVGELSDSNSVIELRYRPGYLTA